jgi:flagellar hook-associated protein 3
MRVTENMRLSNLIQNLNRNSVDILKYQNQVASAKRIQHSSDDPIGTSKVMLLKELIAQNECYQRNVEDAKLWFVATEVAMNASSDILYKAHVIGLQGADDSIGSDERRLLADQTQQLLEQIVTFANRKHGSQYLFGGTVSSAAPYSLSNEVTDERFTTAYDVAVELANVQIDEGSVVVTSIDGTVTYSEGSDYTIDYDLGTITALSTGTMSDSTEYAIAYNTQQDSIVVENADGNEGQVLREISRDNVVQINTPGSEAFTVDVNVFNVLRQLKNALYRNDSDAVRSAAGLLEQATEQIANAQSKVGLKYQILDSTLEDLKAVITQIEAQRSKVEDTDMAEAIVKLEAKNTTYNATLKVASTVLTTSLVDYLG